MSEELIIVERADAIKAFNDEAAFEALYDAIKEKADQFSPDITTAKSRKELASFAHKIVKTKTRIDAVRTELTEEMRAAVAKIDQRGKVMRERLDALRDEVRKPLTDWETAEKARVENIQSEIAKARELGKVRFGETSEQIQQRISQLPTHDLSFYGEFRDEAELVLEAAFNQLTNAKTAAKNAELEAEERRREQEELSRLRRIQEEQRAKEERARAEAEAREAEHRAAVEAREREAQERIRAAEAAAQEAQERAAAAQADADRKVREAEERAATAAREAEEAQIRAAQEAEAQKKREHEEEQERRRAAIAQAAAAEKAEREHAERTKLAYEQIAADLFKVWSTTVKGTAGAKAGCATLANAILGGEIRNISVALPDLVGSEEAA